MKLFTEDIYIDNLPEFLKTGQSIAGGLADDVAERLGHYVEGQFADFALGVDIYHHERASMNKPIFTNDEVSAQKARLASLYNPLKNSSVTNRVSHDVVGDIASIRRYAASQLKLGPASFKKDKVDIEKGIKNLQEFDSQMTHFGLEYTECEMKVPHPVKEGEFKTSKKDFVGFTRLDSGSSVRTNSGCHVFFSADCKPSRLCRLKRIKVALSTFALSRRCVRRRISQLSVREVWCTRTRLTDRIGSGARQCRR